MSRRRVGGAICLMALAVCVVPFMPWFAVDVVGRPRRHSGVAIAGELWVLPVLGAVALVVGLAVLVGLVRSQTTSRVPGTVVAICGALATAWALRATLDISAVAVPSDVPGGPPAPLQARSWAYLGVALSATLAAVGFAWLRSGSDPPNSSPPLS